MTNNLGHMELDISIATVFLNTQIKDDLIEHKCLCCNKH